VTCYKQIKFDDILTHDLFNIWVLSQVSKYFFSLSPLPSLVFFPQENKASFYQSPDLIQTRYIPKLHFVPGHFQFMAFRFRSEYLIRLIALQFNLQLQNKRVGVYYRIVLYEIRNKNDEFSRKLL